MAGMVILDLMGGVALLLWGLHMVQSGVMRAFGTEIRRRLGDALGNRMSAFAVGLGITAVLQSSTATGLMATAFAASGALALVPALALMLGANVGTTLIVQLLSFNVSKVAPVLFLVGVVAFKRSGKTRIRDLGRVAIGLGLMLLALHILLDTLAPAEDAPTVGLLLQSITQSPVLNVALGAIVTMAAHSSVATVLLVMSLAYSHFVDAPAALALVLGANIGSAITPLIEGTRGDDPASRRLPMGNLLTRLAGTALVLPFVGLLAPEIGRFEPDPGRAVADFHTLFNLGTAILFILPLPWIARLLTRLLPDADRTGDPHRPLYLDETALSSPPTALVCAARETLHMGDIVEDMLRKIMTALKTDDRKLVSEVSRMDDAVDRLHEAIKLYVTRVTREALDERDSQRAMEIISFTINLEHIGDIIDRNLAELAGKKIRNRIAFSKEGAAELEALHAEVLSKLKLGFGIFLSGDENLARQMIVEKSRLRERELDMAERHFDRLRDGRRESIESSSLHLDIVRDLKRIHSHICSVAYPVLEAAGELQPNRLKNAGAPMIAETPRTADS